MPRGIAPILLLGLVAGCGSDNGTSGALTNADAPFSARFVERTIFNVESDRPEKTTRGAFNWDTMTGWAEDRTGNLVIRTVQVGDRCFRRTGKQPWTKSTASDPEGTCSFALFGSPKSEFGLLKEVAGLEAVGKDEIRKTQTTHYHGVLSIAAVQGTIDVWVDGAGVVRRSRQVGEGDSFTETRDYYDFGADVTVQPPNLSS